METVSKTDKHTPGKWLLSNEGDCVIITGGPDDNYICTVQIHQTPRVMGVDAEPERMANAKLIAAAPDLIKALKMADECLRDGIPIEKNDPIHEVFQRLIKQATI